MIPVDSLDDPRLSDYRAVANPDALLARGLFVVEGRLLLPRLLDAPRFTTRSILLTATAWESVRPSIESAAGRVPIYVVPQDTMNAIVGFNIHRGCLALAERAATPAIADVDLAACRRLIVLEGVNNPDNIGGVFRNAAAFDVDLVVLGPRCGDPFYRKAIRTSMGATLSVAMAAARAWPRDLDRLRAAGVEIVALTPARTATPLHRFASPAARVALMLGAEGDGLSREALAAADARLRIDISDRVDSLNVATAAAIALHHFAARTAGG